MPQLLATTCGFIWWDSFVVMTLWQILQFFVVITLCVITQQKNYKNGSKYRFEVYHESSFINCLLQMIDKRCDNYILVNERTLFNRYLTGGVVATTRSTGYKHFTPQWLWHIVFPSFLLIIAKKNSYPPPSLEFRVVNSKMSWCNLPFTPSPPPKKKISLVLLLLFFFFLSFFSFLFFLIQNLLFFFYV